MIIALVLLLSLTNLSAVALDATELTQSETENGSETDAHPDAERTAVVVRLLGKANLSSLGELQGWLTHNGRPLPVSAVDERPPQVIIVRDPAAQPILDTLAAELGKANRGRRKARNPRAPSGDEALRSSFAFQLDIDFRIVTPTTAPPAHGRVAAGNVFPYSEPISLHQGGLLWMLYYRPTTFPLRFSDSVVWSADELAATGRRRAVILLLGEGAVDGSRNTIDATRRRLAALQVPLLVWTTASVEPLYPEWNGARSLHEPILPKRNPDKIERALRELQETVERQRVLWLDGRLQPSEIELAPEARKRIELEGGS